MLEKSTWTCCTASQLWKVPSVEYSVKYHFNSFKGLLIFSLLLDKRFFVWIYIKTFILDEYKPEIRPSFFAKDSPLKDCSSLLTNTPTKTTQEDNSPFASQLDSLDLHLESSPFLNTPTKSPSSKIEVRALQNRGKSFMKSMM